MADFPFVDSVTVYEHLSRWRNSNTVSPDEIPFSFIKNIAHAIAFLLAYLFNQSMTFSEVPSLWKHSYVTPVLKKEPASDPSNFRPVSITSIFYRLFEKILKKHILEHLESNKILPSAQHGFVNGKSIETNMLECINDWTAALDDNKTITLYFLTSLKHSTGLAIPN